ncbi:MAG: GDP-mannose 4,6-dehydratase [Thermomicrobiales bacterium]
MDLGTSVAEGETDITPSHTWFITGAAGFIGSHLADALIAQGETVLGLDNLSTGRIANIQHLLHHPRFQFARADVSDEIVMDRLASQSTIIVHLAAAVGVELVVERPAHTIETNVMGTESVLKAALRYGNRVLLASTSEVYGKGSRIPFSEDDDILLGPTSKSRWGYAASKMVDEFLGMAYYHEHGLEVVPFRLFNTTGPRQSSRYGMVAPRFVGQALRNEPITIFGDGTQQRCFCDVRDVVRAIIALALHPEAPGRTYNIGNTEEISIRGLAERVRTVTGSSSEIVVIPYEQAYAPGFEDMQRRVPDISRITGLVGWTPEITLNQTLGRIRDDLAQQHAGAECF